MATPTTLNSLDSAVTGSLRFKLRPLNNWLFCLSVFATVAFVLAQFVEAPLLWLAEGAVIAILVFMNFIVLEKRSIKIRCPHCQKSVRTNTPWVCGECGEKNQQIDEFPFVNRCEHCSAEQKSYKCPHSNCGQLIFLTADKLEGNYAYSTASNITNTSIDDEAIRQKQRLEKEHEIAMAEFDEKLKQIKTRAEGPKVKTLYEQKKTKLDDYYASVMGIRQDVKKLKADAAELYKDDPEGLKDANDTLDACLRMLS